MEMLVVYDSQYGNTEKIAQAIGKVLQEHGNVPLVRLGEVKPDQLAGLDLLEIGSPSQQFRATEAMRTFLKALAPGGLKGVRTAAFDTRLTQAFIDKHPPLGIFERIFGYAAGRIAKALKQKGGQLVLPPEGFYVEDTPGPLVE
ncbi:MAG: flavodoxin family protein, partial [Anaerolineae bacterium]|nr:flavodoxin family protein [Anaerolineae bacterium]